ncbi:MAG: hypothetical protein IJW37_02400 [Lachnospiraceae bacterium]|nr:hypothetical protein [Lachnospiraceae bacterium]
MNTNQITSATNAYQTAEAYKKTSDSKATETTSKAASETADTSAAVYEKNSTDKAANKNSKNKNYVTLSKENQNIVAQLKADAEQRTAQLRSLVESMILKQNQTFQIGGLTDEKMYEMLRKGQVEVSPEVRAQAQKDIAEDGYWGVEQTSERLFSFAKAISGGDTSKAETLIEAMEKGFKLATKSWGDDLPDICQKTLDAAKEKIRSWANPDEETEDMTDAAANEFANQATNATLAE